MAIPSSDSAIDCVRAFFEGWSSGGCFVDEWDESETECGRHASYSFRPTTPPRLTGHLRPAQHFRASQNRTEGLDGVSIGALERNADLVPAVTVGHVGLGWIAVRDNLSQVIGELVSPPQRRANETDVRHIRDIATDRQRDHQTQRRNERNLTPTKDGTHSTIVTQCPKPRTSNTPAVTTRQSS